jgi:hypothetical protein
MMMMTMMMMTVKKSYWHTYIFIFVLCQTVGRDIIAGLVTRYELGGPEIDSQWERDFSYPYRPTLDIHLAYCERVLFPVIMRSGRGVDQPQRRG